MRELICIKLIFGGENVFGDKWHRQHPIYKDAMKDFDKEENRDIFYHLVLGNNNKKFLLDIGIPEDKIIFIGNKTNIAPERAHALYNKVYLLKRAADMFAGCDILFTDYDCNLIRDFNANEIHNILEKKDEIIQCPVVYYPRGIFKIKGKNKQNYGLQTCLTYWKDPYIIKKWFKYQEENSRMWGDETPLILALEDIYGDINPETLKRFDTTIIKTNHRPKGLDELYSPNNYENAYFFHN